MPRSQGDSRCPTNLVEFSSVNQVSAREACLSKVRLHLRAPVRWQAAGELDLILLSVRRRPWVRKAPKGWRAEPADSAVLQGCRKSTIKTQVDHRSLSLIATVNPRRGATASYLVFRLPEKPNFFFFFFE